MKTYRHFRPRMVWTPMVLLAVVAVAAVGVFVAVALTGGRNGPPAFVFLAPLLVVGVNVWFLGRMTYEITLHESSIEMVAPLRRVQIPIRDIERLAPMKLSHTPWFILKHRHGRVVLDIRINDMHELIAELKERNPQIELIGC